jgi:hypothetical protein
MPFSMLNGIQGVKTIVACQWVKVKVLFDEGVE